jgi:hypothetical protein
MSDTCLSSHICKKSGTSINKVSRKCFCVSLSKTVSTTGSSFRSGTFFHRRSDKYNSNRSQCATGRAALCGNKCHHSARSPVRFSLNLSHGAESAPPIAEMTREFQPKRTWENKTRVGGGPRRIRTPDPLIRSQVLYPAELSVH